MIVRLIPQAVPHSIRAVMTAQRNIKLRKLIPTLLARFSFFFANTNCLPIRVLHKPIHDPDKPPPLKVSFSSDAQGAVNLLPRSNI